MKQASKKAKGTKLESWVAKQLSALGVLARRQPGSGAYADFPHDVEAVIAGRRFILECKSWKDGWRTGDRAMGKADLLIIKRNHGTPRVYMHWETFAELVGNMEASSPLDDR